MKATENIAYSVHL